MMNQTHVRSVLFLGNHVPDYLPDFMFHGFQLRLGIGRIEQNSLQGTFLFPDKPHLGRQFSARDNEKVYGKNMAMGRRSFCASRQCLSVTNSKNWDEKGYSDWIQNQIQARSFEVVVYGSPRRNLPFLDVVKNHYPRDKVIFFFGEDSQITTEDIQEFNFGRMFVREIPDSLCSEIPLQ